jgi:phenylacetate-CoA ligase
VDVNVRKQFVRNLLYPLHEWVKGQRTVGAYVSAIQRAQWPTDHLQRFQLDALRRVISLAYQNSPFYKKRFDLHGLSPGEIRSFYDLQRFPFLTKEEIRSNAEQMITVPKSQFHRLVPFSTGGSTGEPVRFYVDRERTANEWAACWRARSWWGLDWGDPWIWLWGSPIELSAGDLWTNRVKRCRDYLLNRSLISAFDMRETTMRTYVDKIHRERPRYIYAYASAAYLLAQFMLERGLNLSDCAPRVVFTTADTLYPHMREAIRAAFCCPVSNEYGSRDGGFIAHECPRGGLHIHADRVCVEIVNGDQPARAGSLGEIVITVLDCLAMPFIRYRTGDVGALSSEPCSCGLTLPLLKSIEGRSSDFLLARNNRLIHGESITHIIRRLDGISRFRVQQESTDSITLEIVRTGRDASIPVDEVRMGIEKLFGYPVALELKFLESLPPTKSGKHRLVVSKLTGRYFEMTVA